ncbi:MAG: TolC family protein [Elusimicrobia bacterium]|nr:TolC family protein [Elusimicrobiota bacterium]
MPSLRELSLEDAERTAILNNPALLSAEQDIVAAEQRVREARFLFYPELGLQASASRYDARYPFALAPQYRSVLLFPSDHDAIFSGRAYLRQSVYEGGRYVNLLKLAQTALKQAQTQYDAVKLDVGFSTRRVFYRLMLAQEQHGAIAKRTEAAAQVLKRGLTGWERVEAEGLAAELRARENEARRAEETARLELLKNINLELDTPIKVVGGLATKPVEIDLDRATLWATELRPELQAETYRAQMDAISVNLAIGRRNPTLELGADYEVTGQRFPLRQNNWDLTVGLKIPFSYDFWTQLKQKKAEQRQGDIKRAEIHDKVRHEVRQAFDDLQFWQREWPSREDDFNRLRALAEAIGAQANSVPALRAQLGVLGAQERWLAAVHEHILARARLERAVGRKLGN